MLVTSAASAQDAGASEREWVAAHLESLERGERGYAGRAAGEPTPHWTALALRCRELIGQPTRGPEWPWLAAARRALPQGMEPEVALTDLVQIAKMRGSPLPEAAWLPPLPPWPQLSTWLGSDTLTAFEAGISVRQTLGRPVPDALRVAEVLRYWRGADGGYAYPLPLSRVFPFVAAGLEVTALPHHPAMPSSLGATASAVTILVTLGLPLEDRAALEHFVRSHRLESGLYRARLGPSFGDDLHATWDALRIASALAFELERPEGTATALRALAHRDGGFAPTRQEGPSLEATWLVLESLRLLHRPIGPLPTPRCSGGERPADVPSDLTCFQAVIEMGYDPAASVELARRAGADLLLLKAGEDETKFNWIAAARIVEARGYPLAVASVVEEHRRAFGLEGLGYVTHCSDAVHDGVDLTRRGTHRSAADLSSRFDRDRRHGARFFSSAFRHRELLTPFYAADPTSRLWDALAGTWAFAPDGDLIRQWPWLERFVGHVPVVGNHDAHGDPFHWFSRGLRTRTLFFATRPDLAGFRDALDHGRVVAVAHGAGEPVLYGPAAAVVRARAERRRWDVGRPEAPKGEWVPEPVVIVLDEASSGAATELGAPFGLLVRAAWVPGDEALPPEISITIDDEPFPLVTVPMHPNQFDFGCLVRLPLRLKGQRRVRVEFDGKVHQDVVTFGNPISQIDERSPLAPPSSLPLRSAEQVAYVRGPVDPALATGGRFGLSSRRCDVFLGRPSGESFELVLGLVRLDSAVTVFVNGWSEVRLDPTDSELGPLRIAIDPSHCVAGAQRITFRMDAPGWLPSFPVLASTVEFDRIALEGVRR